MKRVWLVTEELEGERPETLVYASYRSAVAHVRAYAVEMGGVERWQDANVEQDSGFYRLGRGWDWACYAVRTEVLS